MDASCTVVMGPSSGTLIFRLRMRLCSLIRTLNPATEGILSNLSPLCPIAKAYACSGSSAFPGAVPTPAGLSFGKSWYFLSGCCILQAKGLSPEGDDLP